MEVGCGPALTDGGSIPKAFTKAKSSIRHRQAIRLNLALLGKFTEAARSRGASPLVVGCSPMPKSVRGARIGNGTRYAPLVEALRERKIPVVDASEAFRMQPPQSDEDTWFAPRCQHVPIGPRVKIVRNLAPAGGSRLPRRNEVSAQDPGSGRSLLSLFTTDSLAPRRALSPPLASRHQRLQHFHPGGVRFLYGPGRPWSERGPTLRPSRSEFRYREHSLPSRMARSEGWRNCCHNTRFCDNAPTATGARTHPRALVRREGVRKWSGR